MQNRLRRAALDRKSAGTPDPLLSVANLSDIMLVLAVGFLLALVAMWNLDLFDPGKRLAEVDIKKTVEMTDDLTVLQQKIAEDSSDKALQDYGLEEIGVVYRGKDGKFYIVQEPDLAP